MVLDGKVKLRGNLPNSAIIEATTQYKNRASGVVIGRTLVNPQNITVPLRVINPTTSDLFLYRGTNVALVHPACELTMTNTPSQPAELGTYVHQGPP